MSNPSKNIESVLVENRVFPPDARATQGARISGMAAYEALCKEAEEDFEGFWIDRSFQPYGDGTEGDTAIYSGPK